MLALDELCNMLHNSIREAMANEKTIQARINARQKRHFTEHSPNGWPNSQN